MPHIRKNTIFPKKGLFWIYPKIPLFGGSKYPFLGGSKYPFLGGSKIGLFLGGGKKGPILGFRKNRVFSEILVFYVF